MYIHARTQTWVIEKELPNFAVEYFVNFETYNNCEASCVANCSSFTVCCEPSAAKNPPRSTTEYHGVPRTVSQYVNCFDAKDSVVGEVTASVKKSRQTAW